MYTWVDHAPIYRPINVIKEESQAYKWFQMTVFQHWRPQYLRPSNLIQNPIIPTCPDIVIMMD